MPRNIMSIGRIMYSKMPTKPKLSHFFGFGLPSKSRDIVLMIRVAKTKALISFAFTAKLICAFVFAYADCCFCFFFHAAAHMGW